MQCSRGGSDVYIFHVCMDIGITRDLDGRLRILAIGKIDEKCEMRKCA